ncbi:MAG: hypothetical protein Kow00124_16660 [Anaerolineae bacterium]
MPITVEQQEGISVLCVSGSIDAASSGDLAAVLNDETAAGRVRLVVDLSAVDYISSAGLRAVLAALKAARQAGGDLHIAGAQQDVKRVLELAGITGLIRCFETQAEAVAAFPA